MPIITPDMRAVIEAAHLCFAATVNGDGSPNLSPKGTIRVLDDDHLCFLDIASPNTRANLARDARIEINVVEQLSRRGYRFSGSGVVHTDGPLHDRALAQLFGDEPAPYPVAGVVVIAVDRADELVSPGYLHMATEAEMRRSWRERRASLDASFERHCSTMPFQPDRRDER